MEREPSTNLVNYENALRQAIVKGYLTEDEADLAMEAFIQYEFGDLIEDNRLLVESEYIDNLSHAVAEGWISQEQADDSIRRFHDFGGSI